MKADIGITQEKSQLAAQQLNVILADEFVLYAKTRNYHWNVEGSNFMEMHKFYESLYSELEEVIDVVAERIRSIGHYSQGRLKDFLEQTHLLEQDYTTNQKEQLQNLLEDHETIIRYLRKNIPVFNDTYQDIGNGDMMTSLLKQHEKWAWFIRSYLS
jgi:starvation-inducible DNA-binding protein